jgi:hypothetical protein
MSGIFQTIGMIATFYGGGFVLTKITMSDYDPMEGYEDYKDWELIQLKNRLKSENTERLDEVYIKNLRRCNIGRMYRWDFLNKMFKGSGGYITTWYDSEKKLHVRALVRSDGKLLSSVDDCGVQYETKTILTAKVIDGYVVGVADNVYFSGKGNYPFYKYKD